MRPVEMQSISCGTPLCIEANGSCSIWNNSSCYGSSIYMRKGYTQQYKVEIIYHSVLTDIIDINYHQIATCEDASTVKWE